MHQSLQTGARLGDHWLVWVVYAAEQGYDYDGEEFWSTFETRTPAWTWSADRSSLRNWFRKFHTVYGGLEPTGAWANWFSIIAWPITHALLPKDLQQQLARALYQLRFQVAARINQAPPELGRYVARSSFEASSRFRNFLEQEEIVGRIVLALLGVRTDEAQHFIYPPTLARIVEDLQKARNARGWLRDARQAVQRAQMRGASPAPLAARGHVAGEPTQPQASVAPYIRPRLTLRRTAPSEWTPVVELPSLKPIADLHPEAGQFLRRTRCSVAGSAGALPAGWLAQEDQRRVLTQWPDSGQPMVRFESPNPVVEHLLVTDGCMSSGPLWLFRVGPDGLAREVIARSVRPGRRYVLIAREALSTPAFAETVSLRCASAQAWAFQVPDQLSAADVAAFKSAGLSVAQTVRIRPAGLDARRWDGEGFSEWLEGERPCFALESDSPVIAYEVRLDGEPPVRVPAPPDAASQFIKLPVLAAGQHQLVVRAALGSTSSDASLAPLERFVSLVVRPQQPWTSGSAGHSGLIVGAEPAEPTLDRFWEGGVSLQILGPSGRRVSVCAELHDSAGERLATEQVGDLTLPIASGSWERIVGSFLRRDRDPWAYLGASAGALLIDGDTLGSYRIPLTREVNPVRWVWHKTQRATALRLIDDHQGADPLTVLFYPFATPAQAVLISQDALATAWSPEGLGGLCVARYGAQCHALVASMPQVIGGLSGLLVQPDLTSLPTGDDAVVTILDLIRLWSAARLAGPLAGQRRDHVVTGLTAHLVRLVYGPDWAAAETVFHRSSRTESDMRRLADRTGGSPSFAAVLARNASLYQAMSRGDRQKQYTGLAQRYGIARHDACAAALDLAEATHVQSPLDHAAINHLLAAARRSSVAARGARLISIAPAVGVEVSSIPTAASRG